MSYTYIVIAPEVNRLKVGKANNVAQRMENGAAFCPCRIECIAILNGAHHEIQLHKQLKKHNSNEAQGTEWFNINHDSASIIATYVEDIFNAEPYYGITANISLCVSSNILAHFTPNSISPSFYNRLGIDKTHLYSVNLLGAGCIDTARRIDGKADVLRQSCRIVYDELEPQINNRQLTLDQAKSKISQILQSIGSQACEVSGPSNRSWTDNTINGFIQHLYRHKSDNYVKYNTEEWFLNPPTHHRPPEELVYLTATFGTTSDVKDLFTTNE